MTEEPGQPPQDKGSVDPAVFLTQTGVAWVQLHETYQAAVEGGFTPDQALKIIIGMITAGMKGP